MYSVNSDNPFGGLPYDVKDMMEFGQRRFNPIMGVMSPANIPYATSGDETTRMLRRATNNVDVRAGGDTALLLRPVYNPNSVPNKDSDLLKALEVCEKYTTDDCSAFQNPDFAKNCVMAHELGVNSKGSPTKGGFVLLENERNRQLNAPGNTGYPTFKAMVGKLPTGDSKHPQPVSYDAASCARVARRQKCYNGQTFDPSCGLCTNGDGKYYDMNGVELQSPSLFISGRGEFELTQENGAAVANGKGTLSMEEAAEIRLPSDSEGKSFRLKVSGANAMVSGYLQGFTVSGANRTDLKFLTTNDYETGSKPIMIGTHVVVQKGAIASPRETMTAIRIGVNKALMNINIYIPYTFTEISQPINYYCPNAPFTTKASSATHLSTTNAANLGDPCLNQQAGKQSLECLQNRFTAYGCKSDAQYYPSNEEKANKLRFVNGVAQTTEQITESLYELSIRANTGRELDGTTKFSQDPKEYLRKWNEYSMGCMNKKRMSPCDAYGENEPLGVDCLAFIYNDQGRDTPFGPTYNQKIPDYASLKFKTADQLANQSMFANYPGLYSPRQCTPSGTANPATNPGAAQVVSQLNDVSKAKEYYDNLHKMANSTSLTDAERQPFLQQCYGINLAPGRT